MKSDGALGQIRFTKENWRNNKNYPLMENTSSESPEALRRALATANARIEEQERQIALLAQDRPTFLANMSVQLRTPLDSIRILSGILAANADGNLTAKQVEFATVIGSSSTDLKHLLDELLKLAEHVESP